MEGSLTIFLLLTACFVAATSARPGSDPNENYYYETAALQEQLQQSPQPLNTPKHRCQKLCADCGCHGYFCGDECICQCDYADNKNVRCLKTMRERSQQEAYPFEVLIQGPAGRRFVREATDIDEETMAAYKENERSGRSVYSIYKPNRLGKGQLMAVADGGSDPSVGVAPAHLKHAIANFAVEQKKKIAAMRLGLLGAANPSVGAAADPHVGAPHDAAPADPHVGAPHDAAPADPVVGAAAPTPAAVDPTVGAAAPSSAAADAGPVVGSSHDQVAAPLVPVWAKWPRITVAPPAWGKDLFKRLGSPIVGAPALVVQPEHTL